MAKIKYTKTEQKNQQDALKQFQRFLPTLQLKKQQLQLEVRQSLERVSENRTRMQELSGRLSSLFRFFGDRQEAEFITSMVEVKEIVAGTANIAGITIPVFEKLEFVPKSYDLLNTPWHIDECVEALKSMLALRAAGKILEEQYALLLAELVTTTQRVNLFEKVQIPGYQEAVRKIKRFMEDEENLSKSSQKILKSLQEARARKEAETAV